VAGKGVVLVAQDGKTVKYRGKCATCGREEAGWKSIAIPRGTTRVGFFCPKCRRRTEGEVHGYR
jgi:predicted nucleic-acid-binding Zn-ribbon protein